MDTLILLDQGPTLITCFSLNYPLRSHISKYRHIGGLGLYIWIILGYIQCVTVFFFLHSIWSCVNTWLLMFLLSTPFWKAARHISIIAFKDKIDTALANWEVLDQPCLEVGCPGAGFKALSYSKFLNYFILVITKICSSKWKSLSCVQLFATPCTIQSMELSRPEYWSG